MSVAARTSNAEYLLLAAVSAGVVLAPLNSTMLVVALPDIRLAFGLSHAALGWLVSGYLITMAVAQPLGGRIGDQIGRRRLFRWGLAAFLVASVAATFAPTYPALLILRLLQAAAGALLIPNARAMLREAVPPTRLGRMNGLNSAVTLVAASAGPLLGAALVESVTWRALFAVNVPVVLVALALERRLAFQDPPRIALRLDWSGTLLFSGFLVLATHSLNSLREGASMVSLLGVAGLGFVGLAFAGQQRRASLPAVGWGLLRARAFAAPTAHVLVTNLVMYTTLLLIPFFIEEVQGGEPGVAGILLAGMSTLMAVLAVVSGWIADARGRRVPVVLGSLVALVAATLLLAGLDEDVSPLHLAIVLALLGLGVGLGNASATAAIEAVPVSLAGAAAGTSSTMRYVGSILGSGILAGVLSTDAGPPSLDVFRVVLGVVVGFAVLAVVASVFVRPFPPDTSEAAERQTLG